MNVWYLGIDDVSHHSYLTLIGKEIMRNENRRHE